MIKRLICRLIGHKLDEECGEYHCIQFCTRCGKDDQYCVLPETIPSIYWSIRRRTLYGWKLWFRMKTAWLRKCEDCGKRFGKHDDTKHHLPF